MNVLVGWDIGGANCKAWRLVWDGTRVVESAASSRPLAVWRESERLPEVLAHMAAEFGDVSAHGVTMTAELCDAFAEKPSGVRFILDSARKAFGETPTFVWTTEGRFRLPEQVASAPLTGAATNWLAAATLLARRKSRALLIDIGTTTTDIIPVDGGQVAAEGRDDPGRLSRGELVYTGMVRTPICAVTPDLYLKGRIARLAAEWFAVTGDIYLLLGLLDPADYEGPTPDGRPVAAGAAGQRLARMVCADAAELGQDGVNWLARQVAEAQIATITRAASQVLSRFDRPHSFPVMGAGLGRVLVRQVADRLGLDYMEFDEIGLAAGQAAPASAVAMLLAEEVFSWPAFLQ